MLYAEALVDLRWVARRQAIRARIARVVRAHVLAARAIVDAPGAAAQAGS